MREDGEADFGLYYMHRICSKADPGKYRKDAAGNEGRNRNGMRSMGGLLMLHCFYKFRKYLYLAAV